MKRKVIITSLLVCLFFGAVPVYAQNLCKLYLTLPDYCPVPDNLAVAPDGSLTLSCPNFKGNHPGVLINITKDRKLRKLAYLPKNKKGKIGKPMGLDYGSDGSLYVCNNTTGQVLKMVFEEGKLIHTYIVASGLRPNGLKCHKGYVYVTQPKMPKLSSKNNVVGGLYRFKETETNVVVSGRREDPHLVFTATATNPNRGVSLDGLTFDQQGNLYVAEFGDATIYKLKLGTEGNILKKEIYAQLHQNTGIDGMHMDEHNNLYITGFSLNQLVRVKPNREVDIIAAFPDNDGANGELDQPVDVCIYDDKLLVVNFGSMVAPGMVNQSHDKPYTLSYIDLKDLEQLNK